MQSADCFVFPIVDNLISGSSFSTTIVDTHGRETMKKTAKGGFTKTQNEIAFG